MLHMHAPSPSRRHFLAATLGAAAFPAIIPSRAFGANDRIQVGIIGTGNRGNLLIDQLPAPGELVAASDCFLARVEAAAAKRKAKWDVYQDYRKILDRKDIDAVIVSTPDHDRVRVAIHACQAGKDIYAEKPLTLYIGEGRELVKAVRKYKRVLQVGTQQRSMEMCQISCKLVREGGLGKLQLVQGVNYPSSAPIPTLPDDPMPEKLDWDVWIGQAPMRAYSKKLHTSWMSWYDYAGGEMTNWGCHGLDMIQCALGMDRSGPVELFPLEDGPAGAIGFRYENGVTVHLELPPKGDLMGGGRFTGEKGKIDIWRNNFKIDAPGVELGLPPQEEIDKWHDSRALWQAQYHMGYWLECIPTRKDPNADVEIGHRSASLAHLCNITRRMNRKLQWDPAKERFPHDAEADQAVHRQRRKGYELPEQA
jgi:predicted dehydrogenase